MEKPSYSIITSIWFSNPTLVDIKKAIGVVLVFYHDAGYFVAYIGQGKNGDKDSDEKHIKEWGTKLSRGQAMAFFGDRHFVPFHNEPMHLSEFYKMN